MKAGPLSGLEVVELAGLASTAFACTVLADLGAEIVRVDRVVPGHDVISFPDDPLTRGRRSIRVDTRTPDGIDLVLELADRADVLVEGFRPGVAERMGIGPEVVHARNSRLVYGRLTGYGQDGPLAQAAGHDINYIGISGALEPIGHAGERPVVPLNLVGLFGGGGLLLAMGVLAALYERVSSGRGQVVDASMVDGSAMLTTGLHGLLNSGFWPGGRGENIADGGAPYYDTYKTADGRYVAIGAVETRFWHDLMKVLDLDPDRTPVHTDKSKWPRLREIVTEAVAKYTRDELVARAEGTDACLTPVLAPGEAPAHPHNIARGTFVDVGGVLLPAPAPRFGRTPAGTPEAVRPAGADTAAVLEELGVDAEEIERLRAAGTIA
ncbi:CaiB/BaiF CoA transferase family protein [Lentzea sp. NPDC059081]|uniref:CaiB/BaiF CoA transferase family protein n=1 Tax=Lentzea sp. NPDC059081 TaxID=3346719 RepID=UPI00368EF7E7